MQNIGIETGAMMTVSSLHLHYSLVTTVTRPESVYDQVIRIHNQVYNTEEFIIN